jgi:hypothetical protein
VTDAVAKSGMIDPPCFALRAQNTFEGLLGRLVMASIVGTAIRATRLSSL